MRKSLLKIILLLIFLLQISDLFCSHNYSRYFPFLERPAEYVLKNKIHFSPSLYYTKASTAFKRGGGNAGIPELWGYYDLLDLITSLEKVKGSSFVNPIEQEKGPNDLWIDKSIRFKINGKIKSWGLILNYEHPLGWNNISFGASLPLMHVHTNDNFAFLPNYSASELQNLTESEIHQLDRIRRTVHDELGLSGGDWNKNSFGDLDLHLAWNKKWDRVWLIKSINLNLRPGATLPTESKSDINYPSSVSFMGDGHLCTYFDLLLAFELKYDWKFGILLSTMYQFKKSRIVRLSVYKEPTIFSALIAAVEIDPGMTFKIEPYIIVENLTDGINFLLRYTYLRHDIDKWKDKRSEPSVKSYLNQEAGITLSGTEVTAQDIANNINSKQDLSKWRSHYFSLEFNYDSKDAGNDWIFEPIVYLNYDYQFSGNGVCKTHQLTFGIELHF